jgi:hypothetical protein
MKTAPTLQTNWTTGIHHYLPVNVAGPELGLFLSDTGSSRKGENMRFAHFRMQ